MVIMMETSVQDVQFDCIVREAAKTMAIDPRRTTEQTRLLLCKRCSVGSLLFIVSCAPFSVLKLLALRPYLVL